MRRGLSGPDQWTRDPFRELGASARSLLRYSYPLGHLCFGQLKFNPDANVCIHLLQFFSI